MPKTVTTEKRDDEFLAPVNGDLVLDDLGFSYADAPNVPPFSAAFIVKWLNEIQPEIEAQRRSKRLAKMAAGGHTLRRIVNQWIESGKNGPVHEPYKRSITWHSPEYSESIFQTLATFWEKNRPRVEFVGKDGRYMINAEPRQQVNPEHLSQDAVNRAIWTFQQFLQSRERYLLSRCDGCGIYYVPARAPKRDIRIEHGTFCPACKGKGSVKRMNATRENRTKQRVELAARFWPKWKKKTRPEQRSKWVAAEMNKTLSRRGDTVTGKWVTQHQQEIEAETDRRR